MYTRSHQSHIDPSSNAASSENISFDTEYKFSDDIQTIQDVFGIGVQTDDGQIETMEFAIGGVVQMKGNELTNQNINVQQFLVRQNKGRRLTRNKSKSSAAKSDEANSLSLMGADEIKEEIDESDADEIAKKKRRRTASTFRSVNGNVEIKQEIGVRRSTRALSIAKRPIANQSVNGNSGTQYGFGRRSMRRQRNGKLAAAEVNNQVASEQSTSEDPIRIEDEADDNEVQLTEPLAVDQQDKHDANTNSNTANGNIATDTVQVNDTQTNDTAGVDADYHVKMELILSNLESANGAVPLDEVIDLSTYLFTGIDTNPLESVIIDQILDQEDLTAINLVIDETPPFNTDEPPVTGELQVAYSPDFDSARYKRPDAQHENAVQVETDLAVPTFALYSDTKFDTRLFSKFCQRSLIDECTNANCENPHELPPREELLKILYKMECTEVLGTYNSIVCRCNKLFGLYFAAFTTYFGAKGLRWQLVKMIADTELPQRRLFTNFFHVLRSFVLSGMTYSKALKMLIACKKSTDPEANRIILMFILDCKNKDVLQFLDELNTIACKNECPMDIEMIRKLMVVATELNDFRFVSFVWNVLKKHQAMSKTIRAEPEYKDFRAVTVKFLGNNN